MREHSVTEPAGTLDADVAWVAPILGRAGKLMYMGPILRGLAEKVRDLNVVTAEYGGDTNQTGFSTVVTGGIVRFYRPDPRGYAHGFTLMGPSLFFALCRMKPALLILNEFSMTSMYGLMSRLCNRNARVLLIVEARPWSTPRGVLGQLKTTLRRHIASRADAVLTNNTAGKKYVCDELGFSEDRVIASPYLVSSLDDAQPARTPDYSRFENLASGATVEFLYVGEVIERKGLQDVITAFADLPEEERNRFVFSIVGDGPNLEHIKELARSRGIAERVVFHGRQEYEKLRDFYSRAHVFLFPTHRDYRALAPFEALSMGLPILTSVHDGGACETVSQGKNGFTFDPFNKVQLREILTNIISDPRQLADFAKESNTMSAPYSLTSAVDTLLDACKLALHGRIE